MKNLPEPPRREQVGADVVGHVIQCDVLSAGRYPAPLLLRLPHLPAFPFSGNRQWPERREHNCLMLSER